MLMVVCKNMNYEGLLCENHIHKGTIIMYPTRGDVWRKKAYYIQKIIFKLVEIISEHEYVYLCVNTELYDCFKTLKSDSVRIIPIDYNDIWARDIMPFIKCNKHTLYGVGFNFNAWDGLYYPYDKDAKFAYNISKELKYKYEVMPLTIEGGAVAYNGTDTLITTEDVLLKRNPTLSKLEIEKILKKYLCVKHVIWIKNGLIYDETGGHIDNVLKFASSNEVLLCSDQNKLTSVQQFNRLKEIESELLKYKFKITKIQMPRTRSLTKMESLDFIIDRNSKNRLEGDKFSASYINSYVFNGGIIVPTFRCPYDKNALKIYKELYPNHKIYPIYSKELLIAGGNFHCILHEFF